MQATEEVEMRILLLQKVKNYLRKAVLRVTQLSAVGETGAHGPNLAAFGDRNRVAGFMDHTERRFKRMD